MKEKQVERKKRHISPTTVNTWLSRISAMFGWLMSNGYARRNPASGVKVKVVPSPKKPVLKPGEIALLANACSELLCELSVVITEAALRISEAIKLKGCDVLLAKRQLQIYNSKENRYEYITLSPRGKALGILRRRARKVGPEGLLFATSTGTPLCRKNVRRDLIAAAKRAGIKTQFTGPHLLRKSAVTAASRKLSPAELTQYARHRDARTTNEYYVGDLEVESPVIVPTVTTGKLVRR